MSRLNNKDQKIIQMHKLLIVYLVKFSQKNLLSSIRAMLVNDIYFSI